MKKLTMLLASASLCMPVLACEFHDAPSFGAFGNMQFSPRYHDFTANKRPLTIKHIEQVKVAKNAESVIDLRYSIPLHYRDIKVKFVPSDGLSVLSEEVLNLTQLNGAAALRFNAQTSGEHQITLYISALDNGSGYYKEQTITVSAI